MVPHPEAPARTVTSIRAQIQSFNFEEFALEFEVTSTSDLVLPTMGQPERREGLWRTTCFELFVKPAGGEAYFEFNFSPSFAWAAYAFGAYREGMRDLEMRFDPEIVISPHGDWFWLLAELDPSVFSAGPASIGLCAVIEERDGTRSYWALAHPPGKPDFHHPSCFALDLPPAPAR